MSGADEDSAGHSEKRSPMKASRTARRVQRIDRRQFLKMAGFGAAGFLGGMAGLDRFVDGGLTGLASGVNPCDEQVDDGTDGGVRRRNSGLMHGMYFTNRQELEQFESAWLDGEPVDIVLTTYSARFHSVDGITWDDSSQDDIQSLGDTFGEGTDRTLGTIYYMGDGRADYASVASGNHDGNFRQFAQDLIDIGCHDAFIRVNPEFNLDWSSRYPSNPQNYADAFARLVREMMNVSGAAFTFLFSPAGNRYGVAPESWPLDSQYWPDNAETPIIAPSKYDAWSNYPQNSSQITDQMRQESWEATHQEEVQQWIDFANQRDADLGWPEWGCGGVEEWSNPGGGDNPWFIEKMREMMDQTGSVFQTYWNQASHGHAVWNPEQNPRAAEKVREWMRTDILGSA